MEYKIVTEGLPNEVWAKGFYGDIGKEKAQNKINDNYFHRYMYEEDKHKKLIVVNVNNK